MSAVAGLTDWLVRTGFLLGAGAFSFVVAARFVAPRESARISIGVGPSSLELHLGGMRYVINLVPLFLCKMEVSGDPRRAVQVRYHLVTAATAVAMGLTFLAASFVPALFKRGAPLPKMSRVIITVDPGTPAERAGVQVQWTLAGVGGRALSSDVDMIRYARNAGTSVQMTFTTTAGETRDLRLQRTKGDELLGLDYQTQFTEVATRRDLSEVARSATEIRKSLLFCLNRTCETHMVPMDVPHALLTCLYLAVGLLSFGLTMAIAGTVVPPRRINVPLLLLISLPVTHFVWMSVHGSALAPLAALYGSSVAVGL